MEIFAPGWAVARFEPRRMDATGAVPLVPPALGTTNEAVAGVQENASVEVVPHRALGIGASLGNCRTVENELLWPAVTRKAVTPGLVPATYDVVAIPWASETSWVEASAPSPTTSTTRGA